MTAKIAPPTPSTPTRSALGQTAGSLDCSVCEWTQDEDGNWETDCNEVFIFNEGTSVENGFNFCPYCGRPLIQSNASDQGHLPAEETSTNRTDEIGG